MAVLRLVAEWGDDMRKWLTAKHFTSWLSLAPGDKVSGGRLLSVEDAPVLESRRRATPSRGCQHWQNTNGPRRVLSTPRGPTGKAKAVTATARKLAILFYNALRLGMPAFVRPRSHSRSHRRRCKMGTGGIRRAPRSPRHFALGEPEGTLGQA